MNLVEHEVARWSRDGFLHLGGLLQPLVRERLRRWTAGASDTAYGCGASTAALARHHGGLARLLEQGLLPEVASQLLGAPARPADVYDLRSRRQLTCLVPLDQRNNRSWRGVRLVPGDLLWVRDIDQSPPEGTLGLHYCQLDVQPTFSWSGEALRAGA